MVTLDRDPKQVYETIGESIALNVPWAVFASHIPSRQHESILCSQELFPEAQDSVLKAQDSNRGL